MSNLFPLELEKQFLSALIRNPDILAECPYINEKDFNPETNRPVFEALRSCIGLKDVSYSKFLLIQRLESLNIKIGNVLEPGTYIQSLELIGVNDKAAVGIAREIKRWTIRRELNETAKRIVELTSQDIPKGRSEPLTAGELVSETTKIFNDKVNILSGSEEDEPKDLYKSIPDFLKHENEYDYNSLISPFPIYNDLYGYFDPGDIYVIVARMKVGKSSFGMSIFQQMAMLAENEDMRALVLDTEMQLNEVMSRIVASLSGVKEFYIRHKLYKKRKDMREKVEAVYDLINPLMNKIDHMYIGGWSLEDQLSAVRRWHAKNVKGKSRRGIIALDYFKMNSSGDFRAKTSRDILIGEKVDAYKNLVKKELKIPMIAFAQANREGEDSKQGGRLSNSSVIGNSDMIAQFCSNIYLLERLSAEERAALNQITPDSATHSLKLIAPRQLGPNEMGKDCLVQYQEMTQNKRTVDRWCQNYIMLSFNNFRFSEVGTFKDVYERSKTLGIPIQEPPKDEGAGPTML